MVLNFVRRLIFRLLVMLGIYAANHLRTPKQAELITTRHARRKTRRKPKASEEL